MTGHIEQAGDKSKQSAWWHPLWCADTHQEHEEHYGRPTVWPAQADDVELSLRFGRIDQEMNVAWYAPDPGEKALSPRQLRGDTRLILTVENTAMVQSDGSPVIADVHLNLADAEILYAFLGHHIDRLKAPFIQWDRPCSQEPTEVTE